MRRESSVLAHRVCAPIATQTREAAAPGGDMRIASQVNVIPPQCPGFLGAEPDQQAQHDVGIHQLGRAAHVLQPGSQLKHREGAGCRNNGRSLLRAEGLRRPSFPPLRGVDQRRDVAAHQVAGLSVPDGAPEREVAHAHGRAGVLGGHLRQCQSYVPAVRPARTASQIR